MPLNLYRAPPEAAEFGIWRFSVQHTAPLTAVCLRPVPVLPLAERNAKDEHRRISRDRGSSAGLLLRAPGNHDATIEERTTPMPEEERHGREGRRGGGA